MKKKKVITGWLVADYNKEKWLYRNKPERGRDTWNANGNYGMRCDIVHEITWQDKPRKVRITVEDV